MTFDENVNVLEAHKKERYLGHEEEKKPVSLRMYKTSPFFYKYFLQHNKNQINKQHQLDNILS